MTSSSAPTYATYRSILAQPDALRSLLADGWSAAEEAARLLAPARRVMLAGIGTSFHAAQVGEYLLRAVGMDAWAVHSFDFVTSPRPLQADDAVIVVSHRGSKQYSGQALLRAREAGVPCIGVTGLGTRMEGAHTTLFTAPQEESSCHTYSYTAAMTVLAQVAISLGRVREHPVAGELAATLGTLPGHIAGVLAREPEIAARAREAAEQPLYFVGTGPDTATATEGALKAKEAAYAHAEGMGLEQFLHGPQIAVNAEDGVVVISGGQIAPERVADLGAYLAAVGAHTWLIGPEEQGGPFPRRFSLPALPVPLFPVVAVVPLQLLAYHLALVRGTNPDTFRRADPRYRAALETLVL